MRFTPAVILLLLAFPGPRTLRAFEAASEIRGYVEVQVEPGKSAPVAPLFTPAATAGGQVASVDNEGTVVLSLGGDVTNAATSWWTPTSGKALGSALFGSLNTATGTLNYATQFGGAPGTGASKASLLQVGDRVKLTPFWLVDELLGSPATLPPDSLFPYTTSATFAQADQFTSNTVQAWANDDGTSQYWAMSGITSPDNVGNVAFTGPRDGLNFIRNAASAGPVVMTFTGSAAGGLVMFNIVPGDPQHSGIYRTDGAAFTLATLSNTASGLLTNNPATGLVGATTQDKADHLGIWVDALQTWDWVYYNTASRKWISIAGTTSNPAATVIPGSSIVYVNRPLTLAAGAVKMTPLNNAVSTSTAALPVIDSNHNNLPDFWEKLYAPTKLNPGDDLDFDGFTNLQEFLLGGNPLTFEHPAMPEIGFVTVGGVRQVSISFQTAPWCHYRVETRRGADAAWLRVPVSPGVTEFDGDGTVKTLYDPYTFEDRMPHFYRVVGMPPTDTDGDGVSDYEEINIYHTNPLVRDTDGDGVSDRNEILDGTNPLDYYNGRPPVLTTAAGNGQYQQPGGWLPASIGVNVRTTGNAVLANAPVTFVMTRGKGLFAAAPGGGSSAIFKTRTDSTGRASVFLQLDPASTPLVAVEGVCLVKTGGQVQTTTFLAYPTPFLSVPLTGLQGWYSASQNVTTATGSTLVNAWLHADGSAGATGTGTTRPTLVMYGGRPWVSFNGSQKLDMGAAGGFSDTFSAYFVAEPTATRSAPTPSTAYASRLAGLSGQRYLLGSDANGSSPFVTVAPKAPASQYFSVWQQVYFNSGNPFREYIMPALPSGVDPSLSSSQQPVYRGDNTTGYRLSPAPAGQHTTESIASQQADFVAAMGGYWANFNTSSAVHISSYTTTYFGATYTQEDYYRVDTGSWKGTGGTTSFVAADAATVGFGLSVGYNSMGAFETHNNYCPSTSAAAATGTYILGEAEASSNTPSLRLAGGTTVTGAASKATSLNNPRYIGGYGGAGSGFVGRLGDLLLYDHVLSTADREQLEDYLTAAYRTANVDRNTNSLPDWWERAWFGSLGAVGGGPNDDPDGDGLTNLQEYKLGTNPLAADTDGDGINDGTEVKAKTNPLSPDTDGDLIPDWADYEATNPANGRLPSSTPGVSMGLAFFLSQDAYYTDSDGKGYSDLQEAINTF